jgi:tyrosyl-tRNA synthetase
MEQDLEKQLAVIKKGAVQIVSEDELIAKVKNSIKTNTPLRIKAGFDPTAPDLHLGHTVLIHKLLDFQSLGHIPIFLIGDFTGMIGDPTGRNETRPALSREQLLEFSKTYQKQIFKILDPDKTEVRYNSEWFDPMTPSDFIRLSAQMTVARMLERDDFAKRFAGQRPISVHEFLYPLLQGHDSVALESDVELGGTDQIFNLLVGRDLQRSAGQQPQVVLTMPILEGTDGVEKMSKSYGNYVGIEDPANDIYGKVMSVSDETMIKWYTLLSTVDLEQLKAITAGQVHPMQAKKELALEVTTRYWGEDEARGAAEHFQQTIQRKGIPDDMPELKLPVGGEDLWLPKLMFEAGMVKTSSEGKRMVAQGAVSIDGEKISDTGYKMAPQGEHIVKVGKRRFAKIIFS